jgi:hypothetical protein
MAKIWPVYVGINPTIGEPWAVLPITEAMALFELRPQDFVSDLTTTPRFGDVRRDFWFAGFKYIVVEVDRTEAQKIGLEPGFYRSRIAPKEAFRRLIEQPFVAEFGNKNVLRVNYEPTTDSWGRDALRITVVIAPRAARRLAKGALDASIKLQERLQQMGDHRTPIIEYATEAELAQDAGR